MSKGLKGLMLLAMVSVMVMAFGAVAFADHVSADASATAGADLGPGMGTANAATGGGLEAAAIGEMGNTQFDESTAVPILDLPALEVEEDAQGRIRMDLPGLVLYGPGKGAPAKPDAVPDVKPGPGAARLPVTGVNVGDFAALGMAALSGGAVLLRRLRMAFAV